MPSGKSDTTSAEKMLALYTLLLLSSRAWSLGALAEELQCSKPTVIRLLRKIERFEGVTIYSGQRSTAGRPEKYFGLERTPADIERSRMRIHTEELRLLHLCREVALPLLPATLGKGLLDILRRTSALVPKSEEWREPDMPFLRTATLGGIDYAPQQQTLQTLLKAIEKRCVCEILYTAQDKPQRTHEMAVTSLYSGHHALYARGWKVQEKGRADPVHPSFSGSTPHK